jgi:hypothetical protein
MFDFRDIQLKITRHGDSYKYDYYTIELPNGTVYKSQDCDLWYIDLGDGRCRVASAHLRKRFHRLINDSFYYYEPEPRIKKIKRWFRRWLECDNENDFLIEAEEKWRREDEWK